MTIPTDPRADGLARLLRRLLGHIAGRRRMQFGLLLLLTLASSAAEVISLSSVVPFIGILTDPERVYARPSVASLARLLHITSAAELVVPMTVGFAVAAVAAGVLRVALLWLSIRLGNAIGADFSIEVYRRTLYQPYSVHVSRNSSELISGITQKVANATGVLVALTAVVTSAALLVAILVTLLAIDPTIAGTSLAAFGAGYGALAWRTRRRLTQNSRHIAEDQTTVVKTLQEGLGGIRDVLLDGTQELYSAVYGRAVSRLQRANGENTFINQAPRFVMETMGMLLVAALAYAITRRTSNVGAALPVLGALGLGAQRLLPLLQGVYGNWAVVVGTQGSLADVLGLLDQPISPELQLPAPPPMPLARSLAFDNVRFRYGTGPWVLDGITLTIPKGARVGFIGTTGSGKSTALDVLMALLEPTSGAILVDGRPVGPADRRAWQRAIAHVPQTIYLADATITENIAFGVPSEQIDVARVKQAAARAQIAEFIESRSAGYSSLVGERGVRLSGGQRQRIGIARALYRQAGVLVLDEATSALDSGTEASVMDALGELDRDLTMLIVAHRLTSLQHCTLVVHLEHGRIVDQGPYEHFRGRAIHGQAADGAVMEEAIS